jgi:hypothetical protein
MRKLYLVFVLGVFGCEEMTYPHGRGVSTRGGDVYEGNDNWVDDTYVTTDGGRTYNPRNFDKTSAYRRMQREMDESHRESMRQRKIENDIRNGFITSGYDDIDETVMLSNRLAYAHNSFWSKKRIKDHGEADALWKLQEDEDDKGPSEERMGASDAQAPAWTGKPLGVAEEDREPRRGSGVSTGKALGRFFFGTGDERL